MKRLLSMLLALALLSGCATREKTVQTPTVSAKPQQEKESVPYESRYLSETWIEMSDSGIHIEGSGVHLSNDIIYYEDCRFHRTPYPHSR